MKLFHFVRCHPTFPAFAMFVVGALYSVDMEFSPYIVLTVMAIALVWAFCVVLRSVFRQNISKAGVITLWYGTYFLLTFLLLCE